MAYDFVVIGATGMQGRIVTKDLLNNHYSVLMCGRDKSRILHLLKNKKTGFEYLDLRDVHKATSIIRKSGANVVINCAEGDWDLNALKACIAAKANSVDLGSDIAMTKQQLALDSELKKKDIVHITGCGSVPGVGNIMLRYAVRKLDSLDTVEVGFVWDSNIKRFVVPFSIQSIIEEFTCPAPVVDHNHFKNKVPMECLRAFRKRSIGKENCFIVRHPETHTFHMYFKDLGLKNVRFYAGFPKHSFDAIHTLIELGFGSTDEIQINGVGIKPIDFLTQVLKNLEHPKGYKENENLWVDIYGKKHGKNHVIKMECLVPSLKGWEDAGCNVDTGMPASIIAQMIKENVITEKGSFSPEGVVPPEPFFKELRKRKMLVYENGKIVN